MTKLQRLEVPGHIIFSTSQLIYLVIALDVQLDLFAGQGSDSAEGTVVSNAMAF